MIKRREEHRAKGEGGQGDREIRGQGVLPVSIALFFVLPLIMGALGTLSRAEEEEGPAVVMGIRSLGMGGASVAAVNDEELFFSNPAALSQIENSVFSSFDLKLGFNPESISFLSRMSKYKGSRDNFSDLTETQIEKLNALDPLYKSDGPLNITYIRRYFGVGLFETFDLTFDPIYDPLPDQSSVRVSARQTTFGMISFAGDMELPPWPSRISIGGTLKYIVRPEVKKQDLDGMADDGITAEIGRGFGLDIGALYKIRETYTFGLMIQDALSSQFVWGNRLVKGSIKKEKSPEKTKIDPRAAVGISFTPAWERPYVLQDFVLTLDMDRMRSPEFGAEVTVYRFLKVRTGASDDGIAFGLGFRLGMFTFDYAFVSGFEDEYAGDIDTPSHFVSLAFRL
ncbi:MAG: hypothetical protein ACE5I0_11420 [Candidatus Binatia bacterium]